MYRTIKKGNSKFERFISKHGKWKWLKYKLEGKNDIKYKGFQLIFNINI
jgi:hypothetical protein